MLLLLPLPPTARYNPPRFTALTARRRKKKEGTSPPLTGSLLGWDGFPILTSNRHKTEPPAPQRHRKRGKRGNTQRVGALPAPPVPRRSPRMQHGGDLPAAARRWARTDSGMGSWGDVYPHTDAPTKGHPIQTSLLPPSSFPVLTRAERRCSATPPEASEDFFFPVLSRHARFLLLFNFLLLLHPRQDPSEARSLFPIEFLPAVGFGKHPLPPPCSPRARPAGAGTELAQLPARASAPNEPAQPR